ncbi:MAG: retropepsin-like aspartic protease [Candidatus Lokiarchaeota archaeon]
MTPHHFRFLYEEKRNYLKNPNFWVKLIADKYYLCNFIFSSFKSRVNDNQCIEIKINKEKIHAFLDSGGFINLISPQILKKHFPDKEQSIVYYSGVSNRLEKGYAVKSIPFECKGYEYYGDFLLLENIKQIFKTDIVLGISSINQILTKLYGFTFNNIFQNKGNREFLNLLSNKEVGIYFVGGFSDKLNEQKNKYSELLNRNPLNIELFIDLLEQEFRELDPEKYADLAPTVLRQDISHIIKGSKDFLKDILRKFSNPNDKKRYYPNYKFSIKRLEGFKKRLIRKLGKQPKGIFDLIEYYQESNHNLKLTPRQQYHIYNPNLDEFYFHHINTKEKAYLLGFLLADGWFGSYENDLDTVIGFGVPGEQLDGLYHFCSAIGLNKNKISKDRDSNYYRIKFGCRPMKERFIEFGFKDYKQGKDFPFASTLSKPLYRAFLLGFFDGEGRVGTSKITNTNYQFLSQIKKDFKIDSEIKLRKGTENVYDLFLGAGLFNRLLDNYKDSLKIKRKKLSENLEIYDRIKDLELVNTFLTNYVKNGGFLVREVVISGILKI